jgi:hypothetical protein
LIPGTPIETTLQAQVGSWQRRYGAIFRFDILESLTPQPVRDFELSIQPNYLSLQWAIPFSSEPILYFEVVLVLPTEKELKTDSLGFLGGKSRSFVPTARELEEGVMRAGFGLLGIHLNQNSKIRVRAANKYGFSESLESIQPYECPGVADADPYLGPCSTHGTCQNLPVYALDLQMGTEVKVQDGLPFYQCSPGRHGKFCQTPCPGLLSDAGLDSCNGKGTCVEPDAESTVHIHTRTYTHAYFYK